MEAQWNNLSHAYGSAADIPDLLGQAETDLRQGDKPESAWFALWSALCHQGDIYSASYVALPHLIELAQLPTYQENYEPLWLAAHIELARREGRGPPFPPGVKASYQNALHTAFRLSQDSRALPLDKAELWVYEICFAVFSGDIVRARELLDLDV